MASTSSLRAQEIQRGLAILAAAIESTVSKQEFAQTLDSGDEAPLKALIEDVIDFEDFDWNLLPTSMEDYDSLDLAMDAAELLAYRMPSTSMPTILRLLRLMVQIDGESFSSFAPTLVSSFPPETASAWMNQIRPMRGGCLFESAILDGLGVMAEQHIAVQQELAPKVLELLASAKLSSPSLNAQLVRLAVDWNLVDAAELIERTYSSNLVDCGHVGNWEDVRRKLDVQGLGLPMPSNPIDIRRDLRLKLGVGTFSDTPLFDDDGLDEAAANEYLTRASESFLESKYATNSIGRSNGSHVSMFLELGLTYLGVHADNMRVSDAREILITYYPLKVSQPASETDQTIDELVAFWQYCDEVHHIANASKLAKKIDQWRQEMREAMSDNQNFGMAKSLFLTGTEAGFDMETETGARAFIEEFSVHQMNKLLADNFSRADDAPTEQSPSIPKSLKERKKLLKRLKRK